MIYETEIYFKKYKYWGETQVIKKTLHEMTNFIYYPTKKNVDILKKHPWKK